MRIRAVERAIRVLQELNLQPCTSLAHLHDRTRLPKPTLIRILRTLEDMGFIENDTRLGGYQVSALVTSLSAGFHKDPMVVEAGRPWAIAITRKHRWPVSIALLDGDVVVVRFSTVPDSPVSPFHAPVNMRLPLLTRATGLAYLAFASAEDLELITGMLKTSDHPENDLVRHPEKMDRLLSTVRDRGYAMRSTQVSPTNSNTIAVPIFGETGHVVASLGLTYFTSAFASPDDACDRYVPVLKAASVEITQDLVRLQDNSSFAKRHAAVQKLV